MSGEENVTLNFARMDAAARKVAENQLYFDWVQRSATNVILRHELKSNLINFLQEKFGRALTPGEADDAFIWFRSYGV